MIEPDHKSFEEPERGGSFRENALEIIACFWPTIAFTVLLIPLAWWFS